MRLFFYIPLMLVAYEALSMILPLRVSWLTKLFLLLTFQFRHRLLICLRKYRRKEGFLYCLFLMIYPLLNI